MSCDASPVQVPASLAYLWLTLVWQPPTLTRIATRAAKADNRAGWISMANSLLVDVSIDREDLYCKSSHRRRQASAAVAAATGYGEVVKNRSTLGTLLLIAVIAAIYLFQQKHAPPQPAPKDTTPARDARRDTAANSVRSDVGFRSRQALAEHFEKHGSEFGNITVEQYLQRAQALRDAPVSAGIVERVRSDGVITRFDRRSGAFGAFNSD